MVVDGVVNWAVSQNVGHYVFEVLPGAVHDLLRVDI